MITCNQPYRIINNGPRDLIACIFIAAWQDAKSDNQKWKKDARKFLVSPRAIRLIQLLDVEPEYYNKWVEGVIE